MRKHTYLNAEIPVKVILTILALSSSIVFAKPVKLKFKDQLQAEVSKNYLSFAIDTALMVGGKWWSGGDGTSGGRGTVRTKPLDWKNPELIKLTKALSPAILRIGGSEADHLYYTLEREPIRNLPDHFDTQLLITQMSDLFTFLKLTETELFFTLNAGPGFRNKKGEIQTEKFEKLFSFFNEKAADIPLTLELGNEINAFWLNFGWKHQPSSKQFADDYVQTRKKVQESLSHVKLAGPAHAFWPILGEPLSALTSKLRKVVKHIGDMDVITWHYYPVQSSRCAAAVRKAKPGRLVKVKNLDEVSKWAKKVKSWRDKYSPDSEIWLGETGGAQCGGQAGMTDRFEGVFWWIDQLGQLALLDHQVMIRQSLVGGDYALLERNTFAPRPGYYASLLWKQYMGSKVLSVTSNNKSIRTYAHCNPGKGVSLLVINLDKDSQSINLPKGMKTYSKRDTLTADSLDSKTVKLNGVTLNHPSDFELGQSVTKNVIDLVLPARSITFMKFENFQSKTCL
jgi:heparanase 1